jgi:hypothetical protein
MSPRERHLPQIEQRERDQEWCEEIVEEFNGLIERVNELEEYRAKAVGIFASAFVRFS